MLNDSVPLDRPSVADPTAQTTSRRQPSRNPLQRARHAVAPVAKTLLFCSGTYHLIRRVRPSRRIAILRYHAICGAEGFVYADPHIAVSPAAFRRHVEYLVAHYAVIPLPEAVAALRTRTPLPQNAVAITFDDGYADNLEAARWLHGHGATATFYLTAGCLDGVEMFWPSEVRALVKALRGPVLSLWCEDANLLLPVTTAPERERAIHAVTRLMKAHPIDVRDSLREQLRVAAGRPVIRSPMLTWRAVAEMHRAGMTIGAHTLTHPNLPRAGAADAAFEIAGSKARLEAELGVPVTMFSYPNGGAERYATPEIEQMVRDAGFDAATTSRNGFAGYDSDLYALERVQVTGRLEDLIFALEAERFAFMPRPTSHART